MVFNHINLLIAFADSIYSDSTSFFVQSNAWMDAWSVSATVRS
jgi:hypothetical protein